jgi:hypothetical protein
MTLALLPDMRIGGAGRITKVVGNGWGILKARM